MHWVTHGDITISGSVAGALPAKTWPPKPLLKQSQIYHKWKRYKKQDDHGNTFDVTNYNNTYRIFTIFMPFYSRFQKLLNVF